MPKRYRKKNRDEFDDMKLIDDISRDMYEVLNLLNDDFERFLKDSKNFFLSFLSIFKFEEDQKDQENQKDQEDEKNKK